MKKKTGRIEKNLALISRGKIKSIIPCNVEMYAAFAHYPRGGASSSQGMPIFSQIVAFAMVNYGGEVSIEPLCVNPITERDISVASEFRYFDGHNKPRNPIHFFELAAHASDNSGWAEKIRNVNHEHGLGTSRPSAEAWHRRFDGWNTTPSWEKRPRYSSQKYRPLVVVASGKDGHAGGPSLRLMQVTD